MRGIPVQRLCEGFVTLHSRERQVGDGDFFWEANGRSQFPKMAEDVDAQLQKYKAAVEELNRKTGVNVDASMDPDELMQVRLGFKPFLQTLNSAKRRTCSSADRA